MPTAKQLLQEWITVTEVLDTQEQIDELDNMVEKILEYLVKKESKLEPAILNILTAILAQNFDYQEYFQQKSRQMEKKEFIKQMTKMK